MDVSNVTLPPEIVLPDGYSVARAERHHYPQGEGLPCVSVRWNTPAGKKTTTLITDQDPLPADVWLNVIEVLKRVVDQKLQLAIDPS